MEIKYAELIDQRKMREEVQCFTKGKFSAFRTLSKKVLLQLHCVCKMPECFDNYDQLRVM